MMRKLLIVLLVGAICLTGTSLLLAKEVVNIYTTPEAYQEITGKKISKFSEAPMLKEKVATGELPSLEERLPEEPLVLEPAGEIGQYGGIMHRVNSGQKDTYWIQHLLYEMPLCYSSDMYAPDVKEVIQPNIFKSWTVSDDAKTWTFHIRKGIKWSDGEPFTADDFMFWYEDVALNKDLSPTGVAMFKMGGEMGEFKKIDDYTISYSFPKPYGLFLEKMCRVPGIPGYAPKHFLKQFHPKYTPKDELDKTVKEAGFDTWVSLFNSKMEFWANPALPTICAWKAVTRVIDPIHQFVRNPYYWKVDTQGNQLPYIDRIDRFQVPDAEAKLLKVLAGEIDEIHGNQIGGTENLSVLKEYEKKGNYRILFGQGTVSGLDAVYFNYSHEDPVLRKIINDKRFRIALSVAMNREEINELVYNGTYDPGNPRPPEGPPYYGELPHFHCYTHYDPQLANQLLDAMGLKWDRAHNVRLRPDGKPLNLMITTDVRRSDYTQTAEMYKKYWKDIGVNITTIKPTDPSAFYNQIFTQKHDLAVCAFGMGGRRPQFTGTLTSVVPISGQGFVLNSAWGIWFATEGEKGDEPPDDVKRLYELSQKFVAEPSEEKRVAIGKEIYMIHTENLWVITAVLTAGPTTIWVATERLKNIPDPRAFDTQNDQPSTWFIKK